MAKLLPTLTAIVTLSIPANSLALIIPPPDLPSYSFRYQVKAGDTLWGISREFYGSGSSWQQIAKENNITHPEKLQVGQSLDLTKYFLPP